MIVVIQRCSSSSSCDVRGDGGSSGGDMHKPHACMYAHSYAFTLYNVIICYALSCDQVPAPSL